MTQAGAYARFDHKVVDILKEKDGVFLGEVHETPALRQALAKLLPMFKAHGAGTLSIELEQSTVDLMRAAETYDEFVQMNPSRVCCYDPLGSGQYEKIDDSSNGVMRDFFILVKTAQKLNMKILGHELPLRADLEELRPFLDQYLLMTKEQQEALPKEERARYINIITAFGQYPWEMLSEYGMNKRNEHAAAYIKKHAVGKVVVYGGAHHSGKYTPKETLRNDLPAGSPLSPRDPRALEIEKPYVGLDARLGFPSINFAFVNPSGPVGHTRKTDGRFNTYETVLPENLGDLKTNQWPPKGGVRDIKTVKLTIPRP